MRMKMIAASLGLIVLVLVGAPRAWTGGDLTLPCDHARLVLAGGDPLAAPPVDGSHIPYAMTAVALCLPLVWLPGFVFTMLIVACVVPALLLLAQSGASAPSVWRLLTLIGYVPLLLNLNLVQWLPPALLGLALCLRYRATTPAWLVLAGLPLVTKPQLAVLLAVPLVGLLLYERRGAALLWLSAGWLALFILTWVLRPGWPAVWWPYTQLYAHSYPPPALAYPWFGALLLLLALVRLVHCGLRGDSMSMFGILVTAIALVTPQRALYEGAVLLVVLAMMTPTRTVLAVVAGYAVLLQPMLGLNPALMILLAFYLPALALGAWPRQRGGANQWPWLQRVFRRLSPYPDEMSA